MPYDDQGPDAEGVPPSITELVKSHQDRTGDSLYDIERRSGASGASVSQKYLHRISVSDVKGFPKNVETFSGLAAGLETTELAVLLGYAVQLGIPVRMPEVASQIPFRVDTAPTRLQEALLYLARAIADPEAAGGGHLPDDVEPDVTGVREGPGLLGEVRPPIAPAREQQ